MTRRCASLVLLILALVQKVWALNSILDLPECSTAKVSKDISFPAESHVLTEDTRSLIECAVTCIDSLSLECVRETTTGRCYEVNGTNAKLQTNSSEFISVGNSVTFMAKDQHKNCNDRECGIKEVCMKGCIGHDLDVPICLGDQRGDCEISSEYSNLRHYWVGEAFDDTNQGTVMVATYPKGRDDSALRVILHAVVRARRPSVYGQVGLCASWHLTFDGNKCANPANIQMLDYSEATRGDHQRSIDLDGTCYGLDSGDRKIELVVGPCDGYAVSDMSMGWYSARTMLVMEITPQAKLTETSLASCPLLNVFNYKHETWIEEKNDTANLAEDSLLIKKISYTKLADDTNLRIKYSAVIGVLAPVPMEDYCARWYVKIDGSNCAPELDEMISVSDHEANRYFGAHRRSRTAEGICENELSAGNHTIEIWVGECEGIPNPHPTRVVTGGFNSPSCLHVEEVRQNHTVDGVRSTKQMYRSLSGNLLRQHWLRLNIRGETDLFEIHYLKEYEDTALRLTASGIHKYRPQGISESRATWFFKIDGSECASPGAIEGVTYFDYITDYHQPMHVSGLCHNVSRGYHDIQYAVRKSVVDGIHGNSHTGWRGSFHVFIEELRVDKVKVCSGKPANCDN